MTPIERFSRQDVLRIVGISSAQLSRWEHLELIGRAVEQNPEPYDFKDLCRLRELKKLAAQRVPLKRLEEAIKAVRRDRSEKAEDSEDDLRLVPEGRRIVIEFRGTRMEPQSGQFLLDFSQNEHARVSTIHERSLENWLELALECEPDPERRPEAIDAYRNIVDKAPEWLEPRLNLGTLYYESGDVHRALEEFRCAVAIAPGNPLARFNLASVLDDLGQCREAVEHLEEALRLAPGFADAHYNLARVQEKIGDGAGARVHWQRYIELDPSTEWADYARERLLILARIGASDPVGAPPVLTAPFGPDGGVGGK